MYKTDNDIFWAGKNKAYVRLTKKEIDFLIELVEAVFGWSRKGEQLSKKLKKALKFFEDMEKRKL